MESVFTFSCFSFFSKPVHVAYKIQKYNCDKNMHRFYVLHCAIVVSHYQGYQHSVTAATDTQVTQQMRRPFLPP